MDPVQFHVLAAPGGRDFAACRSLFEQTAQSLGCICRIGRVDVNNAISAACLLVSDTAIPRLAVDADFTFGLQLGVRRALPAGGGHYAITYLSVPIQGFLTALKFVEQQPSLGFLQAQGARVLGDDWTGGGIPVFAFETYCASDAEWGNFKQLIAGQPFFRRGPSFIED